MVFTRSRARTIPTTRSASSFSPNASSTWPCYLPWAPELIHVHDWPSALAAVFARDQKGRDGWSAGPPVCLTIHNLAYQGVFDAAKFALTNLPASYFQPEGLEYYGAMNSLKGGIVHADEITTVSPRYAREITTVGEVHLLLNFWKWIAVDRFVGKRSAVHVHVEIDARAAVTFCLWVWAGDEGRRRCRRRTAR